MPYRLGLDIGTNSIGWTAVTVDPQGRPDGVLGQGVRIFSDGRNPKDGSSLAVQRRVPRGMRRRRDRYLDRRHDLMEMLIALGLMPPDEDGRKGLETLDPYELRAKAIHGPLTPHELGRALFHLNQRRGFKSNRKTDKDADNSKIQPKIDELKRRIEESGATTLGEYLHKRRLKGKMVRARPEAGFYPDRALYEEEFNAIRAVQASHRTLRDTQWDDLKDIIFYQRPLRPVDPGWCLLEDGERRAHRALPLAQEFRMVQEANNLRVLIPGEPAKRLAPEQRDRVLKDLRTKKELKLEQLVKLLKLPSGTKINLLDENRAALKGDETASRLSHKDIFGKAWPGMPIARRSEIVHTLLEMEKPEDIERMAQAQWGLDEAAAKKLAATSLPEGYARLSEKAIAKLLPIMEDQRLNYSEAVAEVPEYGHHSDFRPDAALDALPYYGAILTRQVVGGDVKKSKVDEVGHYGRIANPTVHIGLGQVRRVVNALVKAYGKPEEIVVELARKLKMSKEDQDKERQTNRENEAKNRRREDQIRASGGVPSAHLLRKLRLWDEQQINAAHVCPFTGATISFEMAIDDRTEIEHILPFSKTLDDSMANKVLCLREVNRVKRDRSPFEAFQTPQQAGKYRCVYEEILFRAEALPPNKRWRFHADAMDRFADRSEFLVRQLNETKYLSRIARTYLAHLYNEKAEGKLRVRAIPGRLTAMLRGKWGLNALLGDHNRVGGDADDGPARKNRDDHRHHAIDAFVIAMTDQRLLQKISELNDDAERKRLIDKIPDPWNGFTPDALRPHLDRIVISHKPDHGTFPWETAKKASENRASQTTGALHNNTAYGLIGPGKKGGQKVVSRGPLNGVKKKEDLESIRDAALRGALGILWDEVGGKPADFAKRAEEDGVTLGGRKMKVRRARMVEELKVVQIKDRKTGKPYKAYKPDGNAFADIYQLPDRRWTTVIVQRFDANQPDFDPTKFRPHPASRKLFRLQIDDICALHLGDERRIVRVCKMSTENNVEYIYLADHNEANIDARVRAKELKYLKESANGLSKKNFRKVGVDEIGRLTDPGPRKPDTK